MADFKEDTHGDYVFPQPDTMVSRSIQRANQPPVIDAHAVQAAHRKARPIATGVLAYFPDALAEVAHVSKVGNDQHNPGEPLHWAKHKSTDETDALTRHLLDHLKGETFDDDGLRHLAKVAWRALAALQRELDAEK